MTSAVPGFSRWTPHAADQGCLRCREASKHQRRALGEPCPPTIKRSPADLHIGHIGAGQKSALLR